MHMRKFLSLASIPTALLLKGLLESHIRFFKILPSGFQLFWSVFPLSMALQRHVERNLLGLKAGHCCCEGEVCAEGARDQSWADSYFFPQRSAWDCICKTGTEGMQLKEVRFKSSLIFAQTFSPTGTWKPGATVSYIACSLRKCKIVLSLHV